MSETSLFELVQLVKAVTVEDGELEDADALAIARSVINAGFRKGDGDACSLGSVGERMYEMWREVSL